MEVWKTIRESPNYAISSHGRLKRLTASNGTQAGRILSPRISRRGRGYRYFNISLDGTKKTVKVHRLVATAFIGDPPSPEHHAAHINGDSLDNRVENLRWATATENNRDKQLHGTQNRGEEHYKARLKETDIPIIRALAKNGVGPSAIAKQYGVRKGTIQFLLAGLTWKHVL